MVRPNLSLNWRYVPTIVSWELEAENGLFQPILTLAPKHSKIDTWAGRYHGRGEATNPVTSEYTPSIGPMQHGYPRFHGISAPRGRQVGSGCHNWQNHLSQAAGWGWLPQQSCCAKPSVMGLYIPFGPMHRCLTC